jgi:hypothetical protein
MILQLKQAHDHPCNNNNTIFNIVLQQFKVTSDMISHIINWWSVLDRSSVYNISSRAETHNILLPKQNVQVKIMIYMSIIYNNVVQANLQSMVWSSPYMYSNRPVKIILWNKKIE